MSIMSILTKHCQGARMFRIQPKLKYLYEDLIDWCCYRHSNPLHMMLRDSLLIQFHHLGTYNYLVFILTLYIIIYIFKMTFNLYSSW